MSHGADPLVQSQLLFSLRLPPHFDEPPDGFGAWQISASFSVELAGHAASKLVCHRPKA
jgi:hypothetical protein